MFLVFRLKIIFFLITENQKRISEVKYINSFKFKKKMRFFKFYLKKIYTYNLFSNTISTKQFIFRIGHKFIYRFKFPTNSKKIKKIKQPKRSGKVKFFYNKSNPG